MIVDYLRRRWTKRNSTAFISFLRKKGVTIGTNVHFYGDIQTVHIDITRPSLVHIGDNVEIVAPFALMTHGFEWSVFREKYHEIVGSSGKVVIGNNVYIGADVTILKGSAIGDNVIIGAKSLINKDIPSNCVAAGMPAKRIIDLDAYFEKRKKACIREAKEYALSIYETLGRSPVEEDFIEFFPLFLKRDAQSIMTFNNKLRLKMKKERRSIMSVQSQLGAAFEHFLQTQPYYTSFEDFLEDAGIPVKQTKQLEIS
ncbi:MAG: acyltransferase [Candidatus Thermoplasmatota archaeon]|nr:acyltransferase [Candidatus Thermoplasmatota archaeon]